MTLLSGVSVPESGKLVRRDVAVDGGVIAAITEPGTKVGRSSGIGESRTEVRGEGRLLLPAFVDPHVHVREPGYDYKEDWDSCSRAALKGGAACIFDMPNNKVPVDGREPLMEKKRIALEKSYVDFGLYIALTDANYENLADRRIQGEIAGVKVYMAETTGRILIGSERALLSVFRQPKPVLVHTGGGEGLSRVLSLYEKASRQTGRLPALYICHVSTGDELSLIREGKKRFRGLFAEVTPHHLLLEKGAYSGYPAVLPPLSGRRDIDKLWEAVEDGTIDALGTDHAPHTVEEKLREKPPSGFPGLETAFPLMLGAFKERGIALERLVQLTSEGARGIFSGETGTLLRRGARADLALFEEKEWTVGEDGFVTKCGWSPFKGWKLDYRTALTMVGGTTAFEGGWYRKPEVRCLGG
jgi:dihydroorotase